MNPSQKGDGPITAKDNEAAHHFTLPGRRRSSHWKEARGGFPITQK